MNKIKLIGNYPYIYDLQYNDQSENFCELMMPFNTELLNLYSDKYTIIWENNDTLKINRVLDLKKKSINYEWCEKMNEKNLEKLFKLIYTNSILSNRYKKRFFSKQKILLIIILLISICIIIFYFNI